MSKTITLRPRLSEKTYGLSENRVYVVEVERGINKHAVARAVEAQFDVKVVKVNLTNIPGKSKRVMSVSGKRYMNAQGKRSNIRKAYITLDKGHSLPFFAAIEEAEAQEQATQEKVDKAAAKQTEKDTKQAKVTPSADKSARRGGLHLPGRRGARGGDK
ncbi:MAG TPA: 50S ribosomal protein L23 [Candidatus Saccharimonadales bacterium]|nr:50S ribosomal protein L23 [Candidatus Saccharimonadales bacterium]